jgi:hypothetical protein
MGKFQIFIRYWQPLLYPGDVNKPAEPIDGLIFDTLAEAQAICRESLQQTFRKTKKLFFKFS